MDTQHQYEAKQPYKENSFIVITEFVQLCIHNVVHVARIIALSISLYHNMTFYILINCRCTLVKSPIFVEYVERLQQQDQTTTVI